MSIKEIWVEYYGHAINEPMDNRLKDEIRKAPKELGYVANKKIEELVDMVLLMYMKKINVWEIFFYINGKDIFLLD